MNPIKIALDVWVYVHHLDERDRIMSWYTCIVFDHVDDIVTKSWKVLPNLNLIYVHEDDRARNFTMSIVPHEFIPQEFKKYLQWCTCSEYWVYLTDIQYAMRWRHHPD